jgi:hypothetical protein
MRFYISTQSQLMVATAMSIVALLALGLMVFLAIRYFAEMVDDGVPGHSGLSCRHCTSKSIHASYPSGLVDMAFSLFGCIPYRCEVCSLRFYARRPAISVDATTTGR